MLRRGDRGGGIVILDLVSFPLSFSPYTGAMKFVFASDSFKGSLSSARAGELLTRAAREAFTDAECVVVPIADGGEGTLDALSAVRPGRRALFDAHDGLMRPTKGEVFLSGDEAFVEAASTCGLAMLSADERNPLQTSSYGVGECIAFALDQGYRKVTVGLGGSCTNDGGMGCLRALGVKFFDADGRELAGCGADLERVARIDASGMDSRVRQTSFTIMGDVDNPLLGPRGATHVFGRQKGADDATLARLEAGIHCLAAAVGEARADVDFQTPGYGAAGGLGMALAVFLGAQVRSGIEELLRWANFDDIVRGADLVVTGEGRIDSQSLHGKAIGGVAAHAGRFGVPVAAICGSLAIDEKTLHDLGIERVLETAAGQDLAFALAHAEENYLNAARRLFAR